MGSLAPSPALSYEAPERDERHRKGSPPPEALSGNTKPGLEPLLNPRGKQSLPIALLPSFQQTQQLEVALNPKVSWGKLCINQHQTAHSYTSPRPSLCTQLTPKHYVQAQGLDHTMHPCPSTSAQS